MKRLIVILFVLGSATASVFAQEDQEKTRILFLLDASASMNGTWDKTTKWALSKSILAEIVDSIGTIENLELGLRVYGHQRNKPFNDCTDTKLEVPFSKKSGPKIRYKLNDIKPLGVTPLTYSLEQSARDFPKDANSKNYIIIITDGAESCDADPCLAGAALKENNVILKAFIIGFGLSDADQLAYNCIGTYYDAKNKVLFREIMRNLVTSVINTTTAQVNLLDHNKQAKETNTLMTFYSKETGQRIYNMYHSMNKKGNPDTLRIDPSLDYNLQIHSIPPIEKEQVTVFNNQHNVISVDAAQGNLKLSTSTVTLFKNINNKLKCVIRKKGEEEIIHVMDFDEEVKLLVGDYDLEILTLPRLYIDNVNIKSDNVTDVELAAPGYLILDRKYSVYGGIFYKQDKRWIKIYSFDKGYNKQTIALQSGEYRIVYRSRNNSKMDNSKTVEFKINSGSSTPMKL